MSITSDTNRIHRYSAAQPRLIEGSVQHMAIATVHPTTGLAESNSRPDLRRGPGSALPSRRGGSPPPARPSYEQAGEPDACCRGDPRRGGEQPRGAITLEMGKPIGSPVAEVRKSAKAMRFYADNAERSSPTAAADPAAVGVPGRTPLRAARHGPGGHAVELSAVAGDQVRRPRADGGQFRPAQACVQCAPAALAIATCSSGAASRRLLPHPADRLARGRAACWPTRGSGR